MKNLLKCGLALAAAFSLAACSGGSQSEDHKRKLGIQFAAWPRPSRLWTRPMKALWMV